MNSSVVDYDPWCSEGILRRYSTETRLAIPGEGGVLVAYLPQKIYQGTRYGGATGNYLNLMLDEALSIPRSTTLDIQTLDTHQATGQIHATFEGGEIYGGFVAEVQRER